MSGSGSTWSSSDAPTVGGTTQPSHDGATWSTGPLSSGPLPSGPFGSGLELTPGQIVSGTYRIERKIGAGAMGAVYLATHEKLGRAVALKLHLSPLPSARARTLREAQAMARLSHPNVVTVFDVGEIQGAVFIAMEFLAGGTARDWLKRGPDWKQALDLYRRAGVGLAAAHAAGLVHRDFKPENVLIDAEGRPKVADFGIARAAHEAEVSEPGTMPQDSAALLATVSAHQGVMDATLTQTGAFMGTPAYMAPEQFAGARVDARADQFAFCVALWEALYGYRPFPGSNPAELYLAIRERRFTAPRSTARVPAGIRSELSRGLSLDPATRHRDLPTLLDAIDRALRRRRWGIVAAVGAGLLVLAGAGAAAALRATTSDGAPSDDLSLAAALDAPATTSGGSGGSGGSEPPEGANQPERSVESGGSADEPEPSGPSTHETSSDDATTPSADGFASPDYWDGEGQFKCHPRYPKVELRGRTIVIADESEAAWIAGDCEVRIIDCDITGKTAIDIGGDTKVHIENSVLRAKIHAVDIGGHAEVTIKNTRVVGTTADSTFKAGGYARMTLIDTDVRSTVPLEIFGPATVRVDGGSLVGSRLAIEARGANSIKLRDVEVSGKVDTGYGPPPDRLSAGADWGPEWEGYPDPRRPPE